MQFFVDRKPHLLQPFSVIILQQPQPFINNRTNRLKAPGAFLLNIFQAFFKGDPQTVHPPFAALGQLLQLTGKNIQLVFLQRRDFGHPLQDSVRQSRHRSSTFLTGLACRGRRFFSLSGGLFPYRTLNLFKLTLQSVKSGRKCALQSAVTEF